MKKIAFEKFLLDLTFLDKKVIQLNNFFNTKDLDSTKIINILVELNENLSDYKLLSLEDFESKVINHIGMSNSGMDFNQYKESLYLLNVELENVIKEFLSFFNLNIYFYGNDKFGFIESEFLNYNIVNIDTDEDLKNIKNEGEIDNNKITFNILITEKDISLNNEKFDYIANYEKFIELSKEISRKLYFKYYDYNYINNSLKRSYNNDVKSIIVGNSYALVGIEEQLLTQKAINLSMHSQDLYYAYKLAEKAISKNSSINKCIIGLSYYALWHDLSKCDSQYSRDMVENIYYPILNDKHNYLDEIINVKDNLKNSEVDIILKYIFKLEVLEDYLKYKIYESNSTYYNDLTNVDRCNSLEFFEYDYKEKVGIYRAEQHNKMFKYKETSIEYLALLKKFLGFLKDKNIEPIIVIFPNSKYYLNHLKNEYKEQFNELINNLNNEFGIKIFDLRDSDLKFEDMDFIDTDHLNQYGAKKVTRYIDKFI